MIPFCNWSFRSAFNVIGNASFTGQVETTDCDFYWRLNRSVLPNEIPEFTPLHRFVFRNKGNKPLFKQLWACQQFEILFKSDRTPVKSMILLPSSVIWWCKKLSESEFFRIIIFMIHWIFRGDVLFDILTEAIHHYLSI